jgi:phage gp36-like protein
MAYATIANLSTFGANAATFGSLTDPDKQAALDAASAEADGYLRSRYPRTTLPLVTYGDDLRQAVVKIAVFELVAKRGFNQNAGADQVIVKRADDARAWLKALARGEVSLVVAPDPPGGEQPMVISNTPRGW